MPLGTSLWKASESFYNGLTLAQHGDTVEQGFARRRALVALFPRYAEFWKRHVCPATTRPCGIDFRPGVSDIVCNIAQRSYSVLGKLLDATDSLARVQGGDLGERNRNWRDAVEAAGNALQLTTELQYALGGNPKKPKLLNLARHLRVRIDPFPDWDANWKADRELASRYRNYLVHEGLVYTVHNQATGETLVLGRAGFAAGVNWKQAEASYGANPGHWRPLEKIGHEVFEETVAFIDLTYERLLGQMDGLLTNASYQGLWGWDNSTTPVTMPAPTPGPSVVTGLASMGASSASMTVPAPHKSISSSGPRML